jgi:type II secretory pathway pseudopilin PulG
MDRADARSGREAGFTIIEAMVAMVVSGLLASAMLSLMLGQSRFYERTDDQIWAEQSNRATFDLMFSELRMGSSGDLVAATSDSVSIRFDIMRAIVCDSTAADEAALLAYDTVAAWGMAGGFIGTAYSNPYEEEFEYADKFLPTVVAQGAAPKAVCVANGAPSTAADGNYASLSGWSSSFSDGVPDRGAMVRFYGLLTYRFAPSTFFQSRTALWRGAQELTGPFENGAALSYVLDDGSVKTGVSGGDLESVRSIRVTATAVGDGVNRFDVQRDLRFDIPFRN